MRKAPGASVLRFFEMACIVPFIKISWTGVSRLKEFGEVWKGTFSEVAKGIRPSPIREILSVVKEPGMISFAGGMPAPEVFPVDKFYEGVHVMKEDGADLMQYGTTEGDSRLREFLAAWQKPRLGRAVGLDEIILTTGSQQVLDLLCWATIDGGDVIVTEDPSYLSALSVFESHGAAFETVPMDGHGMIVDELPALLDRIRASGRTVKFIYTIVNFQNPAGATMTVERRKKLAEIADRYGVGVLEDDPYGYVRYDGEHLPSLFSFDGGGNTIYAGSFSKILSPGVRIGWVIGARSIIRQMTIFKQFSDICSSPINQALVYEYCRKGYLDEHIPNITNNYRVKRDAMQSAFAKYLAPHGVKWVTPEGGFFFWLDFGEIDAVELAGRALEKKVAFIPALPFCIDPARGRRYGRMNFTYSQPEVIEEGAKRLAEAIGEMKKGA